jgi:hypothetical protein
VEKKFKRIFRKEAEEGYWKRKRRSEERRLQWQAKSLLLLCCPLPFAVNRVPWWSPFVVQPQLLRYAARSGGEAVARLWQL